MTGYAREADRRRTPFLAALRRRLWEAPRSRREAERRRKEQRTRAEKRLPNRMLEASLPTVLLALLGRGEEHCYGIVRGLEKAGLPPVNEARLYPALRALERNDLIEGYVVASSDGPARKYYRLLPAGAAALEESGREWRSTVERIDALLLRERGER